MKKRKRNTVLFRPKTGQEAFDFMERMCFKCRGESSCMMVALIFQKNVRDEDMPFQWVYVKQGHPKCLNFKARLTKDA